MNGLHIADSASEARAPACAGCAIVLHRYFMTPNIAF